jgi:hypothetical protein
LRTGVKYAATEAHSSTETLLRVRLSFRHAPMLLPPTDLAIEALHISVPPVVGIAKIVGRAVPLLGVSLVKGSG